MTPQGALVIVTLEGDDPAGAFARFFQNHDDFTDWFVEQVNEVHGIDLRQPPPGPLPELIVDSGNVEEENKAVVLRFFDEVLGQKNMAAVHVEHMIAEGDRVAIIGEITATHRGEFQGVPATGKRVAIRNLSQYRVRDGKIVEDYPGFNPMDIMQQIGAMPAAEHAGA